LARGPIILAQIDTRGIDAEFLAALWEQLGTEPPAEPGRWISFPAYLESQGRDGDEAEALTPEYRPTGVAPWSPEDYPELAAWLAEIDAPLDAIAQAVRRPAYWMPLVGDDDLPLSAVMLPHLSISRNLARSYRARVGLAIHEGRIDDAIADVETMRRMAGFLRSEPIMLSQVVGISIQLFSHDCVAGLCVPNRMSAHQAQRLWTAVIETRPPPQMAIPYDTSERAIALDCYGRLLASDEWEPLGLHYDYLTEEAAASVLPRFHRAFNHEGFDVALARDRIQSNFDDYQEIAAQDTFEQFELMSMVYDIVFVEACTNSSRMLAAGSEDALPVLDEAQSNAYTLSVTYAYLRVVRSSWGPCKGEWRCDGYDRAAEAAIGVAHFYAARGRLPESLGDTGLEDFTDPLTDNQPLVYNPDGGGFIVYSIGTNSEDDGGVDHPAEGDLVIRVGGPQ